MKTIEPVKAPDMGRVVTKIKLQNWADVEALHAGTRKEPPRSAEVEALVDTGATNLCLQRSVVTQLGLRTIRRVRVRTISGSDEQELCSPVNLEIMGRASAQEVMVVPDSVPNLVGQIPLESLDFVVDPQSQRLIGNPEHGGKWMAEIF